MKIGLNITENIRVNINESMDDLISDLDNNNISYRIPYSKTYDSAGVKIILIESFGLEIKTNNNLIYSIRCSNVKLNRFMSLDSCDELNVLNALIKEITNNFGVEKKQITVSRFKVDNKNAVIIVQMMDKKVKISFVAKDRYISIEYIEVLDK